MLPDDLSGAMIACDDLEEESVPDRAQVRIIPPLIPLLAIAAGLSIHLLMPDRIGPDTPVRSVGVLLVVLSVGVVLAAARELARHRTAFDVRKSTTTLVTGGIYAFSRNPVYLAMMLLTTGIALGVNSLAMLAVAIPAGSALCLAVIRPEERYLSEKFGRAYEAYILRVRRWI